MKKKQFTEKNSEGFIFHESNFDDKTLVIRDATVLGSVSKNGYNYSEKAMGQVAKLLEGNVGYLNHPLTEEEAMSRGVEKLLCSYHNARFDDTTKMVKADMHLADTPFIREEIYPKMKQFQNKIGNSIVAWGESEIQEETEVVTNIIQLDSADLVSNPATTNGIFESVLNKNKEVKPTMKTLKEFQEAHPELYKECQSNALSEFKEEQERLADLKGQEEKVKYLTGKLEETEKERDDLKLEKELAERGKTLDAMIKKAKLEKLPDIDKRKERILKHAENETDLQEEVDSLKKLVDSFSKRDPHNYEQGEPTDEDEAKRKKVAEEVSKGLGSTH